MAAPEIQLPPAGGDPPAEPDAPTDAPARAEQRPAPAPARPGFVRRLLAGARTRILAAFVVLLAFSTLLSVLAIRQLLAVRTTDRVDNALTQEIEEFRALASEGSNPATGRPFGSDLAGIFRLYFQRNVPGEGESVITFLGGRPFTVESGARGTPPAIRDETIRWGRLTRSERGELETADSTYRYLAVPVRSGESPRGVFVVAVDLGAERAEVDDAVRLVALVLVSVLLIASALAWVIAGRVLSPLRDLTDTARTLSETDLTRRIAVSGNDEIAELGRTFNEHARPAGRPPSPPSARSSATPATSCARRSRSSAATSS